MAVAHVVNGLAHNYSQQIEDLGATIYIGLGPMNSATSEAVWAIKRLSITGGSISIQWANGNDLSINIWDNRASLSYS